MTYSPWKRLADLPHLTLAVTRLPRGRAWWLPTEDAIVLDDRLGRVSRRCALAHELEHADAGDDALCLHGDPDRRLHLKQERRATLRAARKLIDLGDLVEALRWTRREQELAELLDVEVDVLVDRLDHLDDQEQQYVARRVAQYDCERSA